MSSGAKTSPEWTVQTGLQTFSEKKIENKFHKCFDVQVSYDKLQNKFTLICQEELIMIEIEHEFNVQ